MRFCCFLAELHELIRFFRGQGIQVDTIDGLIKVDGSGTQIALRPVALTQGVITGESIVRIVEQHLELRNRLVPALLFLIEPAQKVARVWPIKATFQNLFTEVDSIIKTTLGLICLSLPQDAGDLAGSHSST